MLHVDVAIDSAVMPVQFCHDFTKPRRLFIIFGKDDHCSIANSLRLNSLMLDKSHLLVDCKVCVSMKDLSRKTNDVFEPNSQ